VNELVERLERLEKKIGAQAPLRAATAREAAAPTGVTPHRGGQQPVTAPVRANLPGDKEQVWREFVTSVRKEKKFLASHLDAAQVLELAPGRLSIGVGERLELSFLQDAENLASLKNLAKRFFSEDISIDVKMVTEGPAAAEPEANGGVAVGEPEQKSDMVKEALRIFGGAVRSVRREGG
jgi:hypothetical protein